MVLFRAIAFKTNSHDSGGPHSSTLPFREATLRMAAICSLTDIRLILGIFRVA